MIFAALVGAGIAAVCLRAPPGPAPVGDTPPQRQPEPSPTAEGRQSAFSATAPTAAHSGDEPRNPFAHFLDDEELLAEARRRVETHFGPVGLNMVRQQMGAKGEADLRKMVSSEKEAVRAERILFLRIVDVAGDRIARGEADATLKKAMCAVWNMYRDAAGTRARLGTPALEAAAYPPNETLSRDLANTLAGLRIVEQAR